MSAGREGFMQYELWIIDIEKKTANRVPADKWTDQYIQVIQPGEKGDKLFFQRFKRTWDEVDICVVNTETVGSKGVDSLRLTNLTGIIICRIR